MFFCGGICASVSTESYVYVYLRLVLGGLEGMGDGRGGEYSLCFALFFFSFLFVIFCVSVRERSAFFYVTWSACVFFVVWLCTCVHACCLIFLFFCFVCVCLFVCLFLSGDTVWGGGGRYS